MLIQTVSKHGFVEKALLSFVSIFASLFLFMGAAQAQDSAYASKSSALASNIYGHATVTNSNGDTRRLNVGDTINEGDVINTGKDSGVELTLPNGKVVALGELQKLVYSSTIADQLPIVSKLSSGASLSKSTSPISAGTSAGGSPIE